MFTKKFTMLSSFNLLQNITSNIVRQNVRTIFVGSINEAARKGTREKARAKKVKVEIKKVGFVPKSKKKIIIDKRDKHFDDSRKQANIDDAYIGKYYQQRVYSFAEAIECHRETHHPTMYNVPNAPLIADIELNMQGEKQTRFVDNFIKMAPIQYKFDHGEERKVLVFTKGEENIEAAREAGALLVGGLDLIKQVQNGDMSVQEYDSIIAHTNIMAELLQLRGLMKRKFPNPKHGTIGVDIAEMVNRVMNGIRYASTKDDYQKNFGKVTATFGTLNMPTEHLEDNLKSLLLNIDSGRPKREGKFITKVLLRSPPSGEYFKINPFVYVEESKKVVGKKANEVEDEVEEEEGEEGEVESNRAVN